MGKIKNKSTEIENKVNSEKGSVTLYVLIAMMFMCFVLIGIYMSVMNKNSNQMKQIEKIKAEYEQEMDNIDDIYDKTLANNLIQIVLNKDGNTYNIANNGVVTIGTNISIEYEDNVSIRERKYAWSESSEVEPTQWTTFTSNSITVSKDNTTAGTYYLWVKVTGGNDIEVVKTSKAFEVKENEIGLSKTQEGWKDKVTVTIDYKNTYVTNKKIGIGKTLEEARQNAVANENITVEVTENGFVYVTAEDAYGNSSSNYIQIDNIDNEAPTITLTPNGGEYIVKDGETKEIEVGIEVTDGVSGVDKVEYAWSTSNTEKPAEGEYTEVDNNSTITSEELGEGTYYLWVKATDEAGNVREEPSWAYVVRPPLAPEVSLKENDETGAEYTSGTWTNQDVYHEISIPTSEGTVEKYQYSNDGSNWEDINGETTTYGAELNYTTNFPITSENKPDWLGDLTANGTYYFDIDETNGTLTSAGEHGNKGIGSTTVNSYIKIDLSEFSNDEILNITINANISSQSSSDYGFATVTTSTSAPSYSSSTGRIFRISGTSVSSTTPTDYSTTLTGGKVYYLHFGYRKSASTDTGDDTFTINSITLTSETMGTTTKFNEYTKNENIITYKLNLEQNTDYYVKAIYEDGTESGISQFRIQIDKTAPVIGSISSELTSQTNMNLTISDVVEKDSGLKGYYISTEETVPTVDSNWISVTENTFEIENLNVGTKYYIWLIDNANNISEMTTVDEINANYRIDNSKYAETLEQALSLANNNSTIELLNDYTDTSTATINKNITLNTGDYILTRTATITISGGTADNPITFELNGTVTSSANISTLTTNNYVIIQGTGIIENTTTSTSTSYRALYNTGTLTQEGNLTIRGYYIGLHNVNIYTLNSGKVENTSTTSGYALYNYSSGDVVNINGGEVSGYYGLYNGRSATANIEGGSITGNTYGVYEPSSGTINVNGGYISGIYGIYVSNTSATLNILGGTVVGSTYGIYGYSTGDGKITIGDVNTEVNQVSPVISGGQYGIYMRNNNSYNFYNGIIMGTNTKPYTDTVNPREGYMVYTYYDYNARKYCAVLTTKVDEITIEQTPTNDIWTNQEVNVLVRYPILEGSTLQYSENGQDWEDVNNGHLDTVLENKTIYARMLDASGIVLQSVEHDVTNIDKIAPVVTINPETTKYTIYDKEQTDVDISVTVNVSDEGGSGLKTGKYGWSESRDVQPTQWYDLSDGKTIIKDNCTVGTYYLWFDVSDNAGNVSDVDVIRYMVELEEAVAQIIETGEYYYTIQEAIEAVGTTSATIQIIKDTDEISTIKEGQNITIDLNGHILGSSTSEQATFTNNGTLTIIDNSEEKTGTIENLVGTAIENNGTLTIGDNSTAIDDNTPTISGKKAGIKNNNTLNYYDGTIIGKSAIDGNVQGTPESYGPVGVYEDGMTVVNLRVISDYVARIDWFYYSTLQSAFDACPAKENNEEQTTVHMLKDIILDDTVVTYMGQNIRLNLNGYMLTNSNNTILDNYGDLEITDLTEEQNGNITSSVEGTSSNYYNLITNNGDLNISGGTILSEQNINYLIFNENRTGTVEITDGTVSNNSDSFSYGIYNYGAGTINVIGGTVSSTHYGIYNRTTGIINIEGGEIRSSRNSSGFVYGIYNYNEGTINVTGGTVSSSNTSSYAYGIYNNSTGTINVARGTISGTRYGIYNNSLGTINIEGGTVSSSNTSSYAYGIYNNNIGSINVYGGEISSGSSYAYGIYNAGSGSINVYNGEISSSSSYAAYGIYNNNIGSINVYDGKISSSGTTGSSSAYGIYNAGSGSINVYNGEISSSSSYAAYGIYNNNIGSINVYDGEISSNGGRVYGIYNSITGTITIGTKGDGIVGTNEPSIVVTSTRDDGYVIYNTKGIANFYDGIIQSNTKIVYGGVTEIENNCKIIEDEQNGYKRVYLSELTDEEYIIENLSSRKQYTNIKDAINDVTDNENKLKILKDFTLETGFIIPEDKSVILDLNGRTISNTYFLITNYGNLEITDSMENGKIENENTILQNSENGNLSITGGEISSSSSEGINVFAYGIYNSSTGIINVTGGKISSSSSSSNNTSIYAYGIYNDGSGTINVYGGEIIGSSIGSMPNANGIYNDDSGTINVYAGKISVSNRGGSGRTSSSKGIYNNGSGSINVYNGEISSSSSSSAYGIYNVGSGSINVYNGEISSGSTTGSSSAYGIYNINAGNINVYGGKISSSGSSSSSSYAYGIYNSITGTITIGTKGDGIVSADEPNIVATCTRGYGIYNTRGTFNFYDGRIEGSTRAVTEDSEVTEVEDIQKPQYSEDYKIYAYGLEATDVARIGSITYSSLQDAIDDANETDVIEILRGIQYTNQDTTLTITSGKTITIDLQNHPIVSAIDDAVFTVEGNLNIIDTISGTNGRIISSYEDTIYVTETGILEINAGTITNTQSGTTIVENAGILNVTGGIISQSNTTGYAINNINTGIVNISSGRVEADECSIYTVGIVNITGGRVTADENAITNTDSGILNIENGAVTTTSSSSTVIKNQENANINMTGGEINNTSSYGNKYGINNTSTGNINITEGNISIITTDTRTAYGIYSTAGTINIGTKDQIINTETPNILGTSNGIHASEDCNINIYDGIIKGEISAISGNITSIEEQSEIVVGEETNGDNVYETVSLVKIDSPIAIVNGTQYYSLKEAIDNVSGTGTVQILRTGSVGETIDITSDKNITIDLNNNTLNMYMPFENNGTLNITDTSSSGSGVLTGYKDKVIDNTGTFELLGGTISGMTYGVYNDDDGISNISSGTLSDNEYGIYNSGGTVNVTNGTITGNTYGTFNYSGETNVSGGNITGNEYGVYNSTGTTNISNLTITGNTTEVCNGGTGTTNILSGNIISDTIAVTNTSSGTINIGTQDSGYNSDTPVIQGEQYGIVNTSSGSIAFYDGTVKGKEGSIQGYYLYTETGYKAQTNIVDGYYTDTLALSGTVTTVAKIGDVEYTNLQSAINACTSATPTTITLANSINTSQMFKIEEGQNVVIDLNGYTITTGTLEKLIENAGTLTIIDTNDRQTGKISNTSGVAINNTGTLNLGQDDGTVSTTCPEISGNSTGIVNTGTFNFYDGIIKGAEALDGTITARPNGYVINSSTDQATGMNQLVLGR